jgi:hypothetical protein
MSRSRKKTRASASRLRARRFDEDDVPGFGEALKKKFGNVFKRPQDEDEEIDRFLRIRLLAPAYDALFRDVRMQTIKDTPASARLRVRYQRALKTAQAEVRQELQAIVAGLWLLEFFHAAESSPYFSGDPSPVELCLACRARIDERHIRPANKKRKSKVEMYFPTGGETERRRQTVQLVWLLASSVGIPKDRLVSIASEEFKVHPDTIRRDLRDVDTEPKRSRRERKRTPRQ